MSSKSSAAVPNATGKPPRKQRRTVLAPSQKYEVYTAILTSSSTYRELAEKYNIDPTTIRTICKKAKAGALDALASNTPRGKTLEQVELEEARREIERLKATICEQAMELYLERGKESWD